MDDYGQSKKTLLESNITKDMNEIEYKLLDLRKSLNDIKQYNEDINRTDYKFKAQRQSDTHEGIRKSEELIQDIADLLEGITQYNLNQISSRQHIFDKKNKFSKRLDDYRGNLDQLAKAINVKESQLKDAQYYNHTNSSSNKDGLKDIEPIQFDDDKIMMVTEINTNTERLAQRRKDLENIKVTSGQLNSIASQMREDVYQQGEKLNSIEDNVIHIDEDALKADKEIKKADALSKSTRKKILWLIFIIFFIVVSAAVIAYTIYSSSSS